MVATRQKASLFSTNSATISRSRPKALTIPMPDMLSSTWPLSLPRMACCCRYSTFVRRVTARVSRKISSTAKSAMHVSSGLMRIMAQKIPVTVNPYVSSCVSESDMVALILSTSLVRRLISSPCCRVSKKDRGSFSIWAKSAVRICRIILCPTPAIRNCCKKRTSQSPRYSAASMASNTPPGRPLSIRFTAFPIR